MAVIEETQQSTEAHSVLLSESQPDSSTLPEPTPVESQFSTDPAAQMSSEEVDLPEQERGFLAAVTDQPSRRKRKLSTRKDVQDIIKDMDPALCGPQCQEIPVPPEVLKLNEEFADLFPKELPAGLPPARPTDHRIDLQNTGSSNVPACP